MTGKIRFLMTVNSRNVQRTVAYVFDGVVNDDLVADVVSPAVCSDTEPNIVTVNKWLLRYSRRQKQEADR
jgi:hypothetical protein